MAVAAYFKLDKEAAVEILAEVERTVSNWRVRGRELGMSAAELEQFADAFEHREREVARLRIPADGGQGFQINVDTDSSATWTELRRDGGQLLM